MAGTRLSVEMDDREVQRVFSEVLRRGGDVDLMLLDIAEHMLNSTRARFESQEAPDGTPWEPLSDVTLGRKTRNADKILVQEGDLMREIHPDVSGGVMELSANRVYAAMMQFGGTQADHPHLWGDIPARPFFGFSDDDRRSILEIAQDHLAGAFR